MKKVFKPGFLTFVLLLAALLAHPTDFPAAKPESQGISSAALKKLVEIVNGYVESEQIVGAELVIVKNRHTVLHEVFGWRDREDKIPMAKNTMFNIRSMTKPITGAAARVLIDEGKLKLTDRAADYLPGFKNKKSQAITIEQLLTHRSGLPLTILKDVKDMQKYKDLFTMANAIGKGGPEFEPGSKFWYSDAGSDVLGAVIEVASGMSIDEFFRERLLEPLGMEDTFALTKKDNSPRDRAASLYFGTAGAWKKFWKPADEPFYPFAWGSQTLYSTPQDYARFLAMWVDGGTIGNKWLLSNAAIKRTLTPVSEMTSLGSDIPCPTGFPGFKVYYGQMAMLYADTKASDSKKPVVIGHNGSDGTFAWAWPEQDLMILYFTQSRGQATGIRLETEVHKLLIDPDALKEVTDIPEKFKPYVGKYTANFGPYKDTVFKVFVQNGNLAVDIPGQMIFELNEPDEEGMRSFKLNAAAYPKSWNVYDSLGEAYKKKGDKELAIKNYRKSLELNPDNKNGKKMLEKLEKEK